MNTTRTPPPYLEFGELLAQLRTAAGYAKQQELATVLGVSQQSVSRWEKGLARPRARDIPALESAVRAKNNELLTAAGYQAGTTDTRTQTATSIDRPLPLSALAPETFESFCAALLHRMYGPRGGTVQRYGGTGHKQHGIDILATGDFGTHSFQCKRVNEFGAQKVHTAVAEQTYPADLKVLLLSSVASPNSRDAMTSHSGWELWDREDITRRLHDLPLTDRIDLVDRYFNGQRRDLLGIEEAGPIQSADDFFKPFLVHDRFFNHSWKLIGRSEEVSRVVDSVQNDDIVLTCIVGAPGVGKSRVLREISQRLGVGTRLNLRFVSPTEEVKAHHLDLLRDSRGVSTLVVVDDAHEREDLGTLLRFAAAPENRTRLLFSLRPYGKEALRLQAADVSLSGSTVQFIEMGQQSREQAKVLAESILKECGAPTEAATEIASATYMTPLVTVLAAQLVAKDNVSLSLLANAEEFRTHVLKSLQDVITVTLVNGQDVPKLRALLRVIALIQPFIPDDPGVLNILSMAEGIEQPDASRLMRLLGEAGVLFKRGLRSRLAPDLLADEILHSNYLNADGTVNEGVKRVFELAGTAHLKNLFVNLGRLDWRLREGQTSDSALLASLAPNLRWGERYSNPHVEAVEAVAYYQPRFALDFAKRLIADGHGESTAVCNMVRNAAYTSGHIQEACQLLWKAGRNDKRAMNQQPSHGIRILKELAEFQPNKPLEFVNAVVHFALELLERPASLNLTHSPFTILEGALCTEMEATSYSRNTITFTRYQLPLEQVLHVRSEITGAMLRYLREGAPRRAFLSAQTFSAALRGPMRSDSPGKAWKKHHLHLLQELKAVLDEVRVLPVVLVRIAQSVAWHAHYGAEETSTLAQSILDMLNRDLRTRLTRALVDGWGTETWKLSEALEREEHVLDRQRLTEDLLAEFPDPGRLLDEIISALDEIDSIAGEHYGAPFLLMNHLLASVPGLATALLLKNNQVEAGRLEQYVGAALGAVVEAGDLGLVNEYIIRAETTPTVLAQLAEAYTRFTSTRPYTPQEIELFTRIFQSKEPSVLIVASNLVRQVASRSSALAVELICLTDFEVNPRATHDMFMWLSSDRTIPEVDVAIKRDELLKKLVSLKELDDYWVREFLTASMKSNPTSVIELVNARLDEASRRDEWSYEPLKKEHNGEGLGLMVAEAGPRLLRDFLDYNLKDADDYPRVRRIGDAVAGLCGKYDKPLLDLLFDWMSSGTQVHARVVARVLQESQSTLIYEYPKFVHDILNSAELIDEEAVDEIRSAIAAATLSGVRGGVPGQPFPEDLRMEKHCVEMLESLSRADPAFDLYEGLLKDARYAIARQRRSGEAMEEYDD